MKFNRIYEISKKWPTMGAVGYVGNKQYPEAVAMNILINCENYNYWYIVDFVYMSINNRNMSINNRSMGIYIVYSGDMR